MMMYVREDVAVFVVDCIVQRQLVYVDTLFNGKFRLPS
jgi:hypothetical protein